MFVRCLVVLIVTVAVSSFVPSNTKTRRSDGVCKGGRQPTSVAWLCDPRVADNQNDDGDSRIFPFAGMDTNALAATLIFGSVLLSAAPTQAMMTPDIPQQPTRTAETKLARSTTPTISAPNVVSDSFLTISDDFNPNELRIQQKYLDLAGELKDELKFRAQQGKEKAMEKAKEAQERQQEAIAARDARNKVYDDMFDQAEKERNEFYSKKIISRDSYLQNLREQNQALGNAEMMSKEDQLKNELEECLQKENAIRIALAENKQKDQDERDTKVERTLLKIKLEKAEKETSKIRKDIAVAESIETIRLQRQAEIKVYQDRAEVNEKEKQDALENIRIIKDREAAEFEELRARKRQEAEQLKFANGQNSFERQFDTLDRFDQRKSMLETKTKNEDAARVKSLMKELNQLAAEGAIAATNAPEGQQ